MRYIIACATHAEIIESKKHKTHDIPQFFFLPRPLLLLLLYVLIRRTFVYDQQAPTLELGAEHNTTWV
jgi:hypothetical protein